MILLTQSLPQVHYKLGLGFSDFARHYFRNHFCFLFLRVLRCFSSPGSPCIPIYSVCNNAILLALSSLIRTSTGLWIFAPLRGFSQLVTSFFGAMYQGILRKPFVAWSFSLSTRLSFEKNSISLTRLICSIFLFECLSLLYSILCLLTKLALLSIWKFLPFSYSSLFLFIKIKTFD